MDLERSNTRPDGATGRRSRLITLDAVGLEAVTKKRAADFTAVMGVRLSLRSLWNLIQEF